MKTLRQAVGDYLSLRRSLGFKLKDHERCLRYRLALVVNLADHTRNLFLFTTPYLAYSILHSGLYVFSLGPSAHIFWLPNHSWWWA
jgi:hypothetical protein